MLGETAEGITLPPHLAGIDRGEKWPCETRPPRSLHRTPHRAWLAGERHKPLSITLELVNLGPATIRLRSGMGIAQLLVMRVGLPSEAGYAGMHARLAAGDDPSQ